MLAWSVCSLTAFISHQVCRESKDCPKEIIDVICEYQIVALPLIHFVTCSGRTGTAVPGAEICCSWRARTIYCMSSLQSVDGLNVQLK